MINEYVVIALFVPLMIGICGEVAQKLILGPKHRWPKDGFPGWRGVYYVTVPTHAVLVGACVGLIGHPWGLPVPAAFGVDLGGAVLAYAVAGALSASYYDVIVKTGRRVIERLGQ